MKITFFSNFLNHHQIPFCDEMHKNFGDGFTFVSTEEVPQERVQIGYQDCTKYVYNLTAYTSKLNYDKAMQLGMDSDIVIIGSAPDIFIQERLKKNKHTFRYAERPLKRGNWQLLDPRVMFYLLRHHSMYRRKNLYMLCASAFTANDFSWVFAYPNKKYKWGYFPKIKDLNIKQVIAGKPSDKIELTWVARFIDWKHPELAVRLAFELKKKGYNFHLNMIGTGEMIDTVKNLIEKLKLTDCVSVLGGISNLAVINYMQNSNIFIFTSDRNEGWGAVLNEAMGNGCAVVVSHEIGAAPYVIQHRQNGLIFESENLSDLLKQTESLMTNKAFREELSENAYSTVKKDWSPEKAASNFIVLVESILNGQKLVIESGPCSIAKNTTRIYWKK